MRKYSLELNSKALKCLAIFVLLCLRTYSQNTVLIKSCDNEEPIDRSFVSKNGLLIGTSNGNGIIEYSMKWENKEVLINRFGFHDTLVRLIKNSVYCLQNRSFLFEEVVVSANQLTLNEQLQKFIDKNIPLLKTKKDSTYFRIQQSIYVPKKKWREKVYGNIVLVSNSYQSFSSETWDSFYCDLNVEVDSLFWNNQSKNGFIDHFLMGSFANNGIRKGQFLWKKLDSKTEIKKTYLEGGYVFSFVRKKGEKVHNYQVTYTEDSLIKQFTHKIEIAEGKKTMRIGGLKYDFWRVQFDYVFEDQIRINKYQYDFKLYSKNNLKYSLSSRGERSKDPYSKRECIDRTIFMKYSRKSFKKNNIKVKYY